MGSGALASNTVTVTNFHEIFSREFPPVVRADGFDLTVVPDVGQKFLELLVGVLLLLQEVDPGEPREVVADDHGVVTATI